MTTPAALRELADRVSALLTWGEVALQERDAIASALRMVSSHRSDLVDRLLHEATNFGGSQSHVGELLREAATQLRTAASEGGACHCAACDPPILGTRSYRMVLCGVCGNKRCPHASDHRYVCTGSNATDQVPTLTHPPEVARDAGRYRYLRKHCVRQWVSDMEDDKGAPSLDICFEAEGHDLDAAVDIACGGLRVSSERSFTGGFEQRAIEEREGESDDYIRGHYDGRKLGREESFLTATPPPKFLGRGYANGLDRIERAKDRRQRVLARVAAAVKNKPIGDE